MNVMTAKRQAETPGTMRPPARFHHNNFYTSDFAATRHFYEDLAGMPLCSFLVEPMPETPDTRAHVIGHGFFQLADGALMAFMHYPDDDLQAKMVGTEQPGSVHIAMEVDEDQFKAIRERIEASEYQPIVIDHGIALAMYVRDPNGLMVEFAYNRSNAKDYYYQGREKALEALNRYVAGDYSPTTPDKMV